MQTMKGREMSSSDLTSPSLWGLLLPLLLLQQQQQQQQWLLLFLVCSPLLSSLSFLHLLLLHSLQPLPPPRLVPVLERSIASLRCGWATQRKCRGREGSP